MEERTCRLCGIFTQLQESHVIPSFVYKWLRETSGGGALRLAVKPNRRIQDGYKFYWLCWDCEQRFNSWETQFANQVFHPINQDQTTQAPYSSWFLLFCVSVTWRVLNFYIDQHEIDHLPEKVQISTKRAEKTWREFLLGQCPHPSQYEQHFLPMDAIYSHTLPDMAPNINRYIICTSDFDVLHDNQITYIYSKLGRFIIFGFIDRPPKRQWGGTKVHVKHGRIEPHNYKIPEHFFKYIIDRANAIAATQDDISQRQSEKIEASLQKNINKYADSEAFRALSHDVRLFGQDAFRKREARS